MEPTTKTSLAIPFSIILGFGLIAVAIYFSGSSKPVTINTDTPAAPVLEKVRNIDETDYVRGNPNAQIVIIEYSDYDCPFCKEFHNTMNRIMDEYGVSGKVAWVYRQAPIAQLHPNAPKISEAALCTGELGGNDAFWSFSDLVFGERGINEPTNMTRLAEYAEMAGVNQTEFNSCLNSGRMKEKVNAQYQEGGRAGVSGTPHSFVLIGSQQAGIEGAQRYEVVKGIIDDLIGQLESSGS